MDATHHALPRRASLRCYWLEAKYEFLRMLRSPGFALPTLLFPPMFYLLFGVLLASGSKGPGAAEYLLATYGVFGVMAPGLFGFGVGIAMDRERGFLTLKRAQPVPAGSVLLARMAMAMVFAAGISIILAVIAVTLAGVSLSPSQFARLFVIDVFGVLPFCAMGLYIGSLVGGQGAPAVANLIYLPMAFLSGLWLPLSMLPDFIGRFAPLWPSYHLAQIALGVVGRDAGGAPLLHAAALLAVTALFFALARRRLARAA